MAHTYQEYIKEKGLDIYGRKKIGIPEPDFILLSCQDICYTLRNILILRLYKIFPSSLWLLFTFPFCHGEYGRIFFKC